MGYRFGVAAVGLMIVSTGAFAQLDITGTVDFETRVFPHSRAYDDQQPSTISPSIAIRPELVYEWRDGSNRLTLEPFLRIDAHDEERTHFDLREAHYLYLGSDWDVTIGLSKVFWGVTESVHLVDIINQTDWVEDIDGEDKLGQPMVNLNFFRDWGTLSLFVLPGFRERTFPGDDGRRRAPLSIDVDDPSYESGAEEWHVDYALRWSHTVGNWDFGVSNFYGTSREARLIPSWEPLQGIKLRPRYDIINQLGVDVQYTKGAWLWKLEAISRWGHGDQFFAGVGGFEYTFFGVGESDVDVGVLAELQFDGRDEDGSAPTVLSDHDLFVGSRIALNDVQDTTFLLGAIIDLDDATTSIFVEAERRLTDSWKAELEARWVGYADDDNALATFKRDSSVTLRLSWNF